MAAGDRTHDSRIGALEAGFESMSKEIHGMRTDFRTFTSEFRSEASRTGRTQWSPIIAGVAVVVALVAALGSGPMNDINRLDEWHHQTQKNRFTSEDGEFLKGYIETLARASVDSSVERHAVQQKEIEGGFHLLQGQLDSQWEELRDVANEDFKRPEADAMRAELWREICWLRDRVVANGSAVAASTTCARDK